MSTIKVDTVRPVTTDGSLTLQGDSSGAGVTGLVIDSTGTVTTGTLGSEVTFPAGHIIRTFYDESSTTSTSITTAGSTFSELDISIPSGASTSDYILIFLSTNGIYNNAGANRFLQIGLKYSIDDWATTGSQLGSVEFYDRPVYLSDSTGLTVSSSIAVRVNHPTTSAYRIRPWYEATINTVRINEPPLGGTGTRSTMTVFEIKG